MPKRTRPTVEPPKPRLVREAFEFRALASLPNGKGVHCRVTVKGHDVALFDSTGQIAQGVWDAGKYVRYEHSQRLPIAPQLLDEVDAELRLRMTTPGLQTRVPPPRRSAVGYSNS